MLTKLPIIAFISVMCAAPALSQNVPSGDWNYYQNGDFQIASSKNNDGFLVGVLCNIKENACLSFLRIPVVDCQVNEKYPFMVNSPTGANIMTAVCTVIGKDKYYVLDDFEVSIQAFESGGEIGFAMPMANGKFHVVRFSTIGATPAIKAARTPVTPSKGNSSSQVL